MGKDIIDCIPGPIEPWNKRLYVTIPGPETVKSRQMRTQNENKGVSKDVLGYEKKTNLVAELAAVPTGMAFDQLLREDWDDARKELNKIIFFAGRKRLMPESASATQRRLKLVPIKFLGTTAEALFDSHAVPNLIS